MVPRKVMATTKHLLNQVVAAPQSAMACLSAMAFWETRQESQRARFWLVRAGRVETEARAHYFAGVTLTSLGLFGRGEQLLSVAITLDPTMVEAHVSLAIVLFNLGSAEQAATHTRFAIALRPDLAVPYTNLARLGEAGGDRTERSRLFSRAVKLAPQSSDAYMGYGLFLAESEPDKARTAFLMALILHPPLASAYNNIASLVRRDAEASAGEVFARRALALDPSNPKSVVNLAAIFDRRGQPETANQLLRQAVSYYPANSELWSSLASVALNRGKKPLCEAAIAKAITLEPSSPRYFHILSMIRRFTPDDDMLARMRGALAKQDSMTPRGRAELHFSLAKALNDIGDMDGRLDHLVRANTEIRRLRNYDHQANLGMLADFAQVIDKEYLAHRSQEMPSDSRGPIFIVGMPRSGTSLVEQILSSHPDVHGAGETTFYSHLLNLVLNSKSLPLKQALAALSGADLKKIGREYVEKITEHLPYNIRVTDKTLEMHRFIGLLHLSVPGAKIIHLRRDPIDTCLSCYSQLFAAGHDYSYDLYELGAYWRAYDQLMEHWRKLIPPDFMIEVEYERLVADLEGEVRHLLAFCGLPWNDACINFHETDRVVRTASAAQVRQPIYRNSVGRVQRDDPRLEPLRAGLEGRPDPRQGQPAE